jgi:hypothetical protein
MADRITSGSATNREQDFAYPELRDKEALDLGVCIRLEFPEPLETAPA